MKQLYTLLLTISLPTYLVGQTNNYAIGSTVADFTVTDTDGETYNLYELTAAGKHVILDFFFYGCVPCQNNAPAFSQLHETYGCNDGDLICISVNNGDDTDALAAQFGEDFGGAFSHPPTIGQVEGNALTNTFGVTAFPTFCIIGTDNKMKDDDIWPVNNNMAVFEQAFPQGSNIQPMACVVGIRELDGVVSSTVYPSLTTGPLTLSLDLKFANALRIEIIEATGRVQRTIDLGRLPSGQTTQVLDLSELADGPYVLRLSTAERIISTERVVLAH